MESSLRKNISKVFVFNSSWMFLIILPIMVPYLRSKGLSMQEVFELQSVFSFFVLIFELPSGYIADLIGRKYSLVLASFFHGLGFAIMPFADTYWSLVGFEILLAIGVSLFSGTDISIIYDSLAAIKNKRSTDVEGKIIGKKIFFSQTSEAVAAIVCSFLVTIHLNTPVYVQAITAWIPFLISWTIVEPPRPKMDSKKHKDNWGHILKTVFKSGPLLNLILFNTIFYSASTLLAVWAFQDYWALQGIDIKYFGHLWFLTNIVVGIVAKYAHEVEQRLGHTLTIVTLGVLPIIGYFGMGFTGGVAGVSFCFAFQVSRGLTQVILKDALNSRITGELRATVNSIAGLGMRLVFIIGGPLLGWLIDNKGYEVAFGSFGTFYILVFIFLLLPIFKLRSQFR
jgi:MFS family permease